MMQANRSSWKASAAHLLCVGLLGLGLSGWLGCGSGQPGQEASVAPEGQQPDDAARPNGPAPGKAAGKYKLPDKPPTTARGVLEAMVAAYKLAPTYADAGEVRLYARQGEQVMEDKAGFSVALVRPNKLRMEVYQAKVACDGKKLRASIADLAQQVLELDAPDEITMPALYTDGILSEVLLRGVAGGSPQIMLLVHEDPMKDILNQAGEPELLEPGKIGEIDCYRVAVTRPDGKGTFWIDQTGYVLRRIEFPTDELAKAIAQNGRLDEISLVADFHSAKLGGEVDPKAFRFEVPPDAKVVKFFVPPDPRQMPDPARLLAKAVPDFKFTDLAGAAVTPKQFEGKVTFIDFWGTQCEPCRQTLPKLEKVYQKYKDNPKVTFVAVSVDPASVENKALQDVFAGLGVTIPIARDLEGHGGQHFIVRAIPTSFIVGPDGRVQDYEIGGNPNVEADLPAKIEKLLAGQDIFQAAAAEFDERVRQYDEALKQAVEGKPLPGATIEEKEIPRAQVAPKSDPAVLKLSLLWKSADAAAPGNILVAPRPDGSPRILVIDNLKKVVELGPDGKAVASHDLGLQQNEVVSFLITAAGGDGKRLFGGVAVQQQRVHVYDEAFKLLVHYPEDALKNPHPGIYDAQLADLDADGVLDLFVGYWDAVGVQGAALDGQRKWAFRQISNVARLAVGGPDPQGKRLLWCTHDRGSLVGLDGQGNRQAEVIVQNRPIYAVFAADLTGDGQPEWCGLSVLELGRAIIVGFNLKGEPLWTYELPRGVHEQLIEPVTSGRLSASGPGVWIFPGADGSIHVVGADGKLVDKFNYGARLSGIATATIGGQPALLVATPQGGVEAWKVE